MSSPPQYSDENQVPLLVDLEDKKEGNVVPTQVVEIPTVEAQKGARRGFLKRRIAWYWIAAVAQFCQTILQVTGYASLVTFEGDTTNGPLTAKERFVFGQSAMFSWFGMCMTFTLVRHHYTSQRPNYTLKPRKKRLTAGDHYKCALILSWFNIITLYMQQQTIAKMMMLGLEGGNIVFDIHHVIGPLIIGFEFVGACAYAMAAVITKRGAKAARGTEMVVDPDTKVEAWTLATTPEILGMTTAIQISA